MTNTTHILEALELLRSAPREDLLAALMLENFGVAPPSAPVRREPGERRARNSIKTLEPEMLVGALIEEDNGMRAEDLRTKLGLDKPTMQKSIKRALAEGRIVKEGDKRSTVYKVASAQPHIENPAEVLATAGDPPAEGGSIIKRKKR